LGTSPYAVQFVGALADDVVDATQTAYPLLYSAALIHEAAEVSLYYALLGVDATQPLGNFLANGLEVVDPAQQAPGVVLAGVERSEVLKQAQLIARRPLGVRAGYVWESRTSRDEGASLLANPLTLPLGETYVIFTLPNKLWGHLIAGPDGALADSSDLILDTQPNNFRASAAVSCLRCHADGLLCVTDEGLPFVLANRTSFGERRARPRRL